MPDSDVPRASQQSYRVHGGVTYGAALVEAEGQWAYRESYYIIDQPTAISGIYFGSAARMDYAGIGGVTGIGHIGGAIGWTRMNAAGQTAGLLIGVEGKFSNVTGTTTVGTAIEGNIEILGGLATLIVGCHSTAIMSAGTTTTYQCFRADAPNMSGTCTAMIGLVVMPPTGGTNVNYIGGQILNNTIATGAIVGYQSLITAAGSGTTRRGLQFTGDARNYLAGVTVVGTSDVDPGAGVFIASTSGMGIFDGMARPAATVGVAKLFVDSANNAFTVLGGDDVIRSIRATSILLTTSLADPAGVAGATTVWSSATKIKLKVGTGTAETVTSL